MPRPAITRSRVTIDAVGFTFGRLATRVATTLRGKHKPTFAPNIDAGDFVHVTNLGKVRFTGNKMTDKIRYRYSGYPGGMTATSLQVRWDKDPERVLREAVYNMLPSNRLRASMVKRLSAER